MMVGATNVALSDSARQSLSSDSALEEIKKRGTLRIGLSTFVPWAMRDKKGDLIGFEIDVGKRVAADMGVEIEHIPTAWDGIIPALLAGKFDAIISGMSITMKRNLTVNFTHPYANTGYILVGSTAMAQKKDLKTLEDYNSSDITIATRRASTGAIAAQKNFPKAKLIYFDDGTMGIQETANGKVDATTSTPPKAAYDIEKRPGKLFVVDKTLMSPTREAFAVRKGDPDILNWFNNWIDNVKASGWLQERHAYWFTTREWADQLPD
ncbi:MAG: amino acid ABC transporter substrate-binding protein [Acidiferrobacteraceae bacterium]|nr:amino acid ABC transporter substrate-binding protein [Acidiferrobacteraceae bacterium]